MPLVNHAWMVLRAIAYSDSHRRIAGAIRKNYPRFWKFIVNEVVENKRCPVCGKPVKNWIGFYAHISRGRCFKDWAELAHSIYGREKKSEDEVIELLNSLRMNNGLPPVLRN